MKKERHEKKDYNVWRVFRAFHGNVEATGAKENKIWIAHA